MAQKLSLNEGGHLFTGIYLFTGTCWELVGLELELVGCLGFGRLIDCAARTAAAHKATNHRDEHIFTNTPLREPEPDLAPEVHPTSFFLDAPPVIIPWCVRPVHDVHCMWTLWTCVEMGGLCFNFLFLPWLAGA